MSRFTRLAGNAIALAMLLFSEAGRAQSATGAQSRFYTSNVKRIDSFNLFLKTYCDSVLPVVVGDMSVKKDKEHIRYVGKLYNAAMLNKEFVQEAKRMELVPSQSMRAGLVTLNEYKFSSAKGYLTVTVRFTVIDDRIIYKKFEIINPEKRKCAAAGNAPITFFDYAYLKKEMINDIDFPINGCANCDTLVVDTLYESLFNEVAQKYPAYKFIPDVPNEPLKELIFAATYLQKSYYHNKVVPDLFIQLVKLKEYNTIINLLYSPNHLVAVNAYEALAYLKSTGALEVNSQQEEKMKSIAGSNIEIPVFCGRDCIPTNFPYNTLKITEKNINDKYEAAVKL
jgi:hypothetical protein